MQFTARHRRSLTSNFSALRPDARRTILTDEAVSFQLTLEPLEVQVLSTVTLQTLNRQGWQDNEVSWRRTLARTVNGSLRLSAGVLAIRCRVDSVRNVPSFTPPLHVDVRTAPPILILFSMGGASGIDPPVATGNPNSQAVLQEHGISVNENLCRRRGIDDELIYVVDDESQRAVQRPL